MLLHKFAQIVGKNRAFHWTLKRSKSDGSVFEGSVRDESFTVRRSTSLQSLISTDKLEDDTRMNTLPVSSKHTILVLRDFFSKYPFNVLTRFNKFACRNFIFKHVLHIPGYLFNKII